MRSKKLLRGLLVGLAAFLVALLFWGSGLLENFEAKSWDMRVRLLSKPGEATDKVILILLDQESLDWAEETYGLGWPWPRQIYPAIIDFVSRGSAKSLAFDVFFTESSTYGVADDEAFGAAVAAFKNFIAVTFLSNTTGEALAWPLGVTPPDLVVEGMDTWLAERKEEDIVFRRATFPIPEVTGSAAILANVHLDPDPDGIYRGGSLFSLFDGKLVPSIALASYLVASPGDHHLTIREGKLLIDGMEVPIDRKGKTLLRFRGPLGTHTQLRAGRVIQSYIQMQEGEEPFIDPGVFKNAYVLFGFSAPGLKDLRSTPVSADYPGVEVHATMLDNLLSEDFMRQSPLWLSVLLCLVLALAASVTVSFVSGALKNAAVYASFLPLPVIASLLSYSAGLWLPIFVLEVGIALSLVGGSLLNYATEGMQKRFIKNAFKQYLNPAVIEELILHPERLKLGGEKRELSIFFSDLQGFTGISEGLSPEELTALLNDYLSAMTDIIQEEGGTIDKYEGDAIIAFWNAPLDQPDHALRMVRAALRCQDTLAELRPSFRKRAGKDLLMRIGMNTGPAVVGNMGSRTRFDYTMLGDTVNLASRLEGVNKQFGTFTIVSGSTKQAIREAFPVRELSRVTVVGRKEPVTIFEPFTIQTYGRVKRLLPDFDKGLSAYYRGDFAAASEAFERIAAEDPAAAAYLKKCRHFAVNPPEEWRGVWIVTEK